MVNGSDPRMSPASFLQKRFEGERDPASLINGMAPNFGRELVPHVITYQSIVGSIARVYRDADEATRASLDNARFMRNDCGIMECLGARLRMVALLPWHLEAEDENSHEQKELVETLTKIVQRIRRFTELRRNLLEAVWFGKYAVQHRYGWQDIGGCQRLLPTPSCADDFGWKPINGDKLVFRFDDGQLAEGAYPNQLGIRVGASYTIGQAIQQRFRVELADRSMAYFLSPWERRLLTVHKHEIEDGAFEDALSAGSVNGVGVRSRIYWEWFQKQSTLAFLMEYLERSAAGIEVWTYPMGNEQARKDTEAAAKQRLGGARNVVIVPKPMGQEGEQYGVQIIEPGMAGVDILQELLIKYHGHRIKRLILGQTLTSEAEATGLGSGVADAHLDTLMQIVRYDATNLEETITDELVRQIQLFNFPASAGIRIRFSIDVEHEDVQKKLEAWQMAYEMGCRIKERDVMDLVGAGMPTDSDRVLSREQQQAAGTPGLPGLPGLPGAGPGMGPDSGPDGGPGTSPSRPVAPGSAMSPEQFQRAFDEGSTDGGDIVERYGKGWEDQPRDDQGRWSHLNVRVAVASSYRPRTRKEARQLGDSLRGEYVNHATGKTIHVYKDAIKDSVIRHQFDWRALSAIPQLVAFSVPISIESPIGDHPSVKEIAHYFSPLTIAGEMHLAKLTVKTRHDEHYSVEMLRLYNIATKKKGLAGTKADTSDNAPGDSPTSEPTVSIGELRRMVKELFPDHAGDSRKEQYARRKPSSRQKPLLGDEQKELRWITIGGHAQEGGGKHHGGTHVQIDRKGNIVAGPDELAAKGITNLADFGTEDHPEKRKPKAGKKPDAAEHQPGLFEPDEELGGQKRLGFEGDDDGADSAIHASADTDPETTDADVPDDTQSHWDTIRTVRTQRFGTIPIDEALEHLRNGRTLGIGGNRVVTGIYPDGRETSLKGDLDGFSNMAGSLVIGIPEQSASKQQSDSMTYNDTQSQPQAEEKPLTAYQQYIRDGGSPNDWEEYAKQKNAQSRNEAAKRTSDKWVSGKEMGGTDIANALRAKGVAIPDSILGRLQHDKTTVSLTSASGAGMKRDEARKVHKWVSEQMGTHYGAAKGDPTIGDSSDDNLVTADKHPGNGTIVTDSDGKEWLVMKARHGFVEAAPIESGKAVVNRDSVKQFYVGDNIAGKEQDRLVNTGRNYYEEREAAKAGGVGEKTAPHGDFPGIVSHSIDVDKKSIFAQGQKRGGFAPQSIAMSSLKGANAVWHNQGDPNQVIFNAAQKDAKEWTKNRAEEIKAAKAAGYSFVNHRAGKYGTLWLMEKDGRVLTERGAKSLVDGTAGVGMSAGEDRENAKPIIDATHRFIQSLPESTRENLGALVAAVNRSPLGKHLEIARDSNGMLRLSSNNGGWRVYEPSSGRDESGQWHQSLDSSLPRFLSKLGHMAETDIGKESGDWASHDRAADEHAVIQHPPSGAKTSPPSESASEPALAASELAAQAAEPENGPKDGDRNAEGLVFRDGRWHREDEAGETRTGLHQEQPVDENIRHGHDAVADQVFSPETHGGYQPMLDLAQRVRGGEVSAEELRQHHAFWSKSAEAFQADLQQRFNAQEMKNIAGNFGIWTASRNSKGENAKAIYEALMVHAFVPSGTFSYGMEGKLPALRKFVDNLTDEKLAAAAETHRERDAERLREREERAAKLAEPQTVEDFAQLAKLKGGEQNLTREQRQQYDELRATERRKKTAEEAAKRAAVTGFEGGESRTGGIDIVEGHHQKKGVPTYTVTVENRLGEEGFGEALNRAKKLGGSYVNARVAKAYGATPGFQFFDQEKAEQFAAVLRGESVDRSGDMEARQAEREATRAATLQDRGAGIVGAGENELGRERLENTARRAAMAQSAEANARAKIATGRTLQAIGEKLESGELKHLRGVSAATHVDTLDSLLRRSRYDRWQEEGTKRRRTAEELVQKSTGKLSRYEAERQADEQHGGALPNYEKFHEGPPTDDDIDAVKYPYPRMWQSDLRQHAEAFSEVPGLKKIAAQLKKAATDNVKFQSSAGGYKTSGGQLIAPRAVEQEFNGKLLGIDPGKRVRVHASHDYRLAQGHAGGHRGPFYTADKGKTWAVSPTMAVAGAFNRGNQLDLVDAPQDQLLTFRDADDIQAMRTAASRLRRSSDRNLQRVGENLHWQLEDYKRMQAMDITSPAELRAALREYLPLRAGVDREDPIKKKERALRGRKIEGFFPTPRPLIDKMLDAAGIEPGHTVLEPSAGKGDILDAVRERHPEASTEAIEPVGDLREIVQAKGHKLVANDFLGHRGQYDRIVMNPPFEKGADIDHVRHAYEQLKPGGRLVAVMSDGPFYRNDAKATEFRDWLETVGGDHEANPEGSFSGPDSFRQTGVNTRLVTIEKPAAVESQRYSRRTQSGRDELSQAFEAAFAQGT